MAFDFADIASRYLDRRIDQATQPFTDPEAYMNRRLGFGDEGANVTPRSTTISYNDDGTQTITNKMEMGPPAANAPQAAEPFPGAAQYALPQFGAAPQPMAQPVAQPVAAQPAVDPAEEERRRREAALQQQQAAIQAQPQAVQLQPPTPAPQVGPTPEPAAPAAPVAPQPMAQPQPAAAAPAAPEVPVTPQQVAAPPAMPPMPQPGPGTQLAGPMVAGAVPQAQPPAAPAAPAVVQSWLDQVGAISDNPTKLAAFMGNESNSEESRKFAAQLLKENLNKTSKEAEAEKKVLKAVEDGNMLPLMKEIKSKSEEGSYVKAYLYARLGLTDLARDEQKKLGAGATYQAVVGPDGERALLKFDADGLPTKGFDASGKQLSDQQLAAFAANASATKGLTTHTQAYKDRTTGELFWQRSNGQLVNDKGQVYKGNTNNLYAYGIGSDVETKNVIQLNALRNTLEGQKAEDRIRTLEKVNQTRIAEGLKPFNIADVGLDAQGRFTTTPGVATNVPTIPGAVTQLPGPATQPQPAARPQTAAPAPMPAAPVSPQAVAAPTPTTEAPTAEVVRRREEASKGRAAGQEKAATMTGEVLGSKADLKNMMGSIDKAVNLLDSGKHNVGSELSVVAGRGPIAQAVGSQLETTDAKNTKLILDTVNKLAADGLKVLGSNPSGPDLKFWTENKPNAGSDPEFMKEWIISRKADLARRIGYAEAAVGGGGAPGTEVPAGAQQEKTIGGVTYVFDGKGWKKK